jgi:LysR family glycine cleavage system transcriptional activator
VGSFTKAAEELGVTSAAVGQQVRTLEAWIGSDLFERENTAIIPTAGAQRVGARLTAHITGLSEVLADLRDSGPDSRLSITLPASFAENWFASRIPEFWRAHPSVDLRLNATNRMVDLRREPFDFALRFCDRQGPKMEAVELFGDFVAPVCTPALAQRHDLSNARTTLEGVPLVHLDDRTPDRSWANWDMWAEAFGVAPPMAAAGIRYREVSSGLHAARLEQGLVLAGLVEAHAALESGELVAPFGAERNCPTEYSYHLVWPRGRKLNAVQAAFVDWMKASAIRFRASLEQLVGENLEGSNCS